ncbi:competence protein CoiA family protein [Salisediminibacterium beveridgei]|uniref:Competence protein CoiA n=1 Tax=Salisediminibacterium beveridgei TaxID=632773 RepID=A0A1D7QWJ4_9BACI|nr:competence protein CoiA family protein [Salisediminibacterium beveridgei]AOM83376.1 Competence protein CoiA [Salisediminibacterium beveridgei]
MLCKEEQHDYQKESNESATHQSAKAFVVEWLARKGVISETEKWIPVIQRRADIYFQFKDQEYVIEIQLSFINRKDFRMRYEDYLSVDIVPFWVGVDQVDGLNSDQKMTLLDELLIQMKPVPHACYIDVEKGTWLFRHGYFYLQNRTLTACEYVPDDELSIGAFLNKSVINQFTVCFSDSFIRRWLSQTKRKRLQKTLSLNQGERTVLGLLQEYGLNLNYFPAICRVPLQQQYILKTPPEIWQTWLLLAVIQRRDRIVITDLCDLMSEAVGKGIIQIRSNFMEDRGRMRLLVTEFVCWLHELGVVGQEYPGVYQLEHSITVKKNLETLLQDDELISKRYLTYLETRKK